MLTRVRRDLSLRTRGPVGMPAPRTAQGSSTFPGLYMRPNPANDESGDPRSMALDVYVGALTRYYAGDWESIAGQEGETDAVEGADQGAARGRRSG